MIPWQPIAFTFFLAALVIIYERWALPLHLTLTEGWRALAKKARWVAVLVLILDLFFVFHCFAKSLGVSE